MLCIVSLDGNDLSFSMQQRAFVDSPHLAASSFCDKPFFLRKAVIACPKFILQQLLTLSFLFLPLSGFMESPPNFFDSPRADWHALGFLFSFCEFLFRFIYNLKRYTSPEQPLRLLPCRAYLTVEFHSYSSDAANSAYIFALFV